MNAFIKYDEKMRVTEVHYNNSDTVDGYVRVGDLPEPEDENQVLMFDPNKQSCYFEGTALSYSERVIQVEQENADLKNSVMMLEDIVMMLTASQF